MSIDEALADVTDNRKALAIQWKNSLQKNELAKNIQALFNDETKTYEITSNLLHGANHSAQGVIQTVRDITQSVKEHQALTVSYKNLAISMQALQEKNQHISLLVEMSDIMLACNSLDELKETTKNFSRQLLSFASGYLFIMHPSKNYLEKIISWGDPNIQQDTFTPEHCWGIRLGRMHQYHEASTTLICPHSQSEHQQPHQLCVPLMAQNDIYGALYLETNEDNALLHDENQKLLITAFSELTALALANVRLRENLRHQSIRDALTGLYNRRYLEEFLYKHIEQAKRDKQEFAILMLDLDHFKKINDTYGHEAGDQVLKEVGEVFVNDIRTGDLACRFGGEEFLLFLHHINLENAEKTAENLRHKISHLNIRYGAEQIGPITISIGVALYPIDGQTIDELVNAADKALYEAKNKGRNRIVMYTNHERKHQI